MTKCPKTTSGKHYWGKTPRVEYGSEIRGKWLDRETFLKASRECLACGLIDDFGDKKKKEKVLFTAWHCPKCPPGGFVCENATQADIDEHLNTHLVDDKEEKK